MVVSPQGGATSASGPLDRPHSPSARGWFGDTERILVARSLRAFGDGYVAILVPVHLAMLGSEPLAIGVISTATLLGSALLTLGLGLSAHKVRRRPAPLAASLLMLGTGLGFALATGLWPVLLVAFVGTQNPSGEDVSVFLPLEHTVIAHTTKLSWADIGHSEQPGVFTIEGREISISPEHIRIWQEHPEVVFEVIELRGGGGLSSYALGGWPPPNGGDGESGAT